MRPTLQYFIIIICLFTSHLWADVVESSDAGKAWKQRQTDTVQPAKIPDRRNSYGGFRDVKLADKGFFRLNNDANHWSLIDPDGYLFLSIGVNSVNYERVDTQMTPEQWANQTKQLLTSTGFNTIGRWSTPEPFATIGQLMPWCSSLKFMKSYAQKRSRKNGASGYPNETLPVFDRQWPAFCQSYAEQHLTPTINDRYLLGHFSDNELPFRPDALVRYLALPTTDPGYQAAVDWMEQHQISDPTDREVQDQFLKLVASLYFDTVAQAIKRVDPNHLYIGSRLHGRCISKPVLQASQSCDVVSINYYHAWRPSKTETRNWYKWSQRPFLVGEFYAMKLTGKDNPADWGAGFRVRSHQDAGKFYHTYTKRLLEDIPNCIGWHWFKYADDVDYYQKGIVGVDGDPHQTLLRSMKALNEQAYSLSVLDLESSQK